MRTIEFPPCEYITDAHREQYRAFVLHHLVNSYARPLPNELWHYTDFGGLSGITKSGALFSTQVTCLNDTREQGYFGDLVHEAAQERLKAGVTDELKSLIELEDAAYKMRDFSSTYHFVTCFSEAPDDLNQWRGYGGGECGYAIAFNSAALLEAINKRPGSVLVPILYDDERQRFFARDVIKYAEGFFLAGLQESPRDLNKWTREFFTTFAQELDIFASATKFPAFASERERRIVTSVQVSDLGKFEFRQKRTLLSRHLPFNLTAADGRLPITRICIGPSPSQTVTRVSLALFLEQNNYPNLPLELSRVPYRIV